MKKIKTLFFALTLFILTPSVAGAVPVSLDFDGSILQPLRSGWSALIKGDRFQATSTSQASIFPYASTTVLSAATICLTADLPCRTTWPSGAAFPFTPTSYGNSTTSVIGFLGGLFSVGSTTVTSLTSGLVGNNNGLLYGFASSSLFGYTPLNPTRQLTVAGTANQITSSAGAQDLSADRTWTLSLPNHVIFPGNFQATNSSTTNATTTGSLYVTGPFASTTNFYANGLTSCNSASNALTWSAGAFGCNTITGGGTFPFTPTTNFGATANATGTPIWFQSGLQASSTSHFVNASTTQLGVSSPDASALLLQLENTNADADPPILRFFKNSSSPENNDDSGRISFFGTDNGNIQTEFARIHINNRLVTDTTEEASFNFATMRSGVLSTLFQIGQTGDNGIAVGTNAATGIIESNGNQDLTIQTGNSTTGSVTIADGANANITISPNGTGDVLFGTNTLEISNASSQTFTFPNFSGTFCLVSVNCAATTTANSWTGLQTFNSGLLSIGSSTIGNGTQIGGLTVSGGATTSGNAYFGGNVGINALAAATKLHVIGGSIFEGTNTNVATNTIAAVEFMTGRTSTGALPSGASTADLALSFSGTSGSTAGGFRHFIRSLHSSTLNSPTNAIEYYLNNSATSNGSSAPGTGNTFVMGVYGNGAVGIGTSTPSSLYALGVQGNALISGNLNVANLTATGTATIGSLSGGIGGNNGALYAFSTTTMFGSGTAGQVLMWSGSTPVWAATSTCVQITGSSALCDGDDATGAGGAFSFTPTTNFGAVANATGTPIWFQSGLQASSTSYLENITHAIKATTTIAAQREALVFATSTAAQVGILTISGNSNNLDQPAKVGINIKNFARLNNSVDGLQIQSESTDDDGLSLIKGNKGGAAGNLFIQQATSGGTLLNPTIVPAGTMLGRLIASAHDGTGFLEAAAIDMNVENTPAEGAISGVLSFHTAFQSNGSTVEKMRINSLGLVGIGDTSPDAVLEISNSASTSKPFLVSSNDNTDGDWLTITSSGNVGIGTTTPFSRLSVHANNGDTNRMLFAIGSSTASATTTLFSVDNTGAASTTKFFGSGLSSCTSNNVLTWSSGLFGCETDDTAAGAANPFTWETNYGAISAATTSPIWAKSGLQASSTSRMSTTTFDAWVGIGTTTPTWSLQVNRAGQNYLDDLNGAFAISDAGTPTMKLYAGYDTALGSNGSGFIQAVRKGTAYTPLILNPNGGQIGIGSTSPRSQLDVKSTITTGTGFYFFQSGGTSGDFDSFVIQDDDVGAAAQDESSTLKVNRSGSIATGADAHTLLTLDYTGGGTPGSDRQFFVLGRDDASSEGAVDWGISLGDADFWTTGALRAGATGTDCGGTGAACFNTAKIAFETSGDSYLNTGGDFGLGTTTPQWALTASNATKPQIALTDAGTVNNAWTMRAINNNFYLATSTYTATSTVAALRFDSNGHLYLPTLTVNGSVHTYTMCGAATTFEAIWDTTTCALSNRAAKTNIADLDIGLEELMRVRPVVFNWKPTGDEAYDNDRNVKHQQIGVIADEVAEIDTRLITYDNKGEIKGFRYDFYTAWLTKALQEQQEQIEQLKGGVVGVKRPAEENWQWLVMGVLALGFIYQQVQLRKLRK